MNNPSFYEATVAWLQQTRAVKSAVQNGSSAHNDSGSSVPGEPYDLDLHLIVSPAVELERVPWPTAFQDFSYVCSAVRPATGGVRKTTVIFREGVLDIVLVPEFSARLARFFLNSGLYRRVRAAEIALNEMATSLRFGFEFIKGERRWRVFYESVVREMPGVRLSDREIRQLADVFTIDYCWVLRKIKQGELRAAQHILHKNLSETNLRLYRELRLRRGQSLPSFGLGRHLEEIAAPDELSAVSVSARLDAAELRAAADHLAATQRQLMAGIDPTWTMPEPSRLASVSSAKLRA